MNIRTMSSAISIIHYRKTEYAEANFYNLMISTLNPREITHFKFILGLRGAPKISVL